MRIVDIFKQKSQSFNTDEQKLRRKLQKCITELLVKKGKIIPIRRIPPRKILHAVPLSLTIGLTFTWLWVLFLILSNIYGLFFNDTTGEEISSFPWLRPR